MVLERSAGFVVFRIVNGRTEFLLLQASYLPHHWTPPKGHVDPGEDEWVAAIREAKEEADIDGGDLVVYQDCTRTLQYEAEGRPKTVKYWLAELKDANKEIELSNEHQDYKWLEEEAAVELAEYEEVRDLIRHCGNYLRNE